MPSSKVSFQQFQDAEDVAYCDRGQSVEAPSSSSRKSNIQTVASSPASSPAPVVAVPAKSSSSFSLRRGKKTKNRNTSPPSAAAAAAPPEAASPVPSNSRISPRGVSNTSSNNRGGIIDAGDDAIQSPKRLSFRRGGSKKKAAAAVAASSVQEKQKHKKKVAPTTTTRNGRSTAKPVVAQQQHDPHVNNNEDEDDPVMEIFNARSTQRVRFALEENCGGGGRPINKERGRGGGKLLKKPPSSLEQQQQQSVSGNKGGEETDAAANRNALHRGTSSSFNIKKFMKKTLFGSSKGNNDSGGQQQTRDLEDEELEREIQMEMKNARTGKSGSADQHLLWTTNNHEDQEDDEDADATADLLRTDSLMLTNEDLLNMTFSLTTEEDDNNNIHTNRETRATIIKLLNKARRAQLLHYRYSYAVKCYVKALELLQTSHYPEDHPTVVKTILSLRHAHFANSSYTHSANIVKLGIKYEDTGELIRALKMYTIAYRIRRDNLSPYHPSLVVLLNMLGNIQLKRGELDEAMAIYELALKDTAPPNSLSSPSATSSSGDDDNSVKNDNNNNNTTSPQYPNNNNASNNHKSKISPPPSNHLTRAVTYREMGTIHEQWGDYDEALNMYHRSLDCMVEYKGLAFTIPKFFQEDLFDEATIQPVPSETEILEDLERSRSCLSPPSINSDASPSRSSTTTTTTTGNNRRRDQDPRNNDTSYDSSTAHLLGGEENDSDDGMEMMYSRRGSIRKSPIPTDQIWESQYEVFFPKAREIAKNDNNKQNKIKEKNHRRLGGGNNHKKNSETTPEPAAEKGDQTDVDVALTIHRIAQLHRAAEEYHLALPTFNVALRGMKYALGKSHQTVAAILGNIGNLQKEMGDMDSAYATYQQVLAIESYRLGLSHPDVVVTLHNVATIDAARGNHEHALSLYTQVISLQRKLFGEDHESVAVTSACMGDVYERLGDNKSAVDCYEDALRIKISALGRHSLEVARLLHKLGKLAVGEEDYYLAQSYISKAALVYKLNKLQDDNEWVVDVRRDAADIDAAIALGRGADLFEC